MTVPISVIITVYNRQHLLPATIESVLAQTYPDFELLIWDDGSTDESVAVAQKYAQRDRRIRVVAAPHQGLAPTRAQSTSQTFGQYFGWVDSDDLLAPTALAATAEILNAHPEVGVVYTDHQMIDLQGRNYGMGQRCAIPYSPSRLLVDLITFHFRLIRRSVYDQVGGVDPSYELAEDYDLCLRLSEVTQIYHLPQPLYQYRRHTSNVTNNQIETIRWSALAIQAALKRRRLDQNCELSVKGQYSFTWKASPSEASGVAPPASPLQLPAVTPLVSILIPSYNVESRVADCLRSCFQQTYPNLEIIVIDNGSTDRTVEVIKACADRSPYPFHLLHCPEPGANPTRNTGFLQARGHYIQWLDSDDELDPNKIAAQVHALEQHPAYDIAYGDWQWHFFHGSEQINQLSFPNQPHEDMLFQLLMDNWRPPHAYLLRRNAAARLHHLQAWHPRTRVCTDREYFTLAATLGHKFLYVPQSKVHYMGWSPNQVSRSAPYLARVQSRSRILQRCWDVAHILQSSELQKAHRFLLGQDWNLWQPAFTLIEVSGTWKLQHHHTTVQQPLTLTEAIILSAFLRENQARPLEDHARWIIRHLLWAILAQVQDAKDLVSLTDNPQISQLLAQLVGLPVKPFSQLNVQEILKFLSSDESLNQPQLLLFQQLPVFAPLFGEQCLAVQGVLERLRQQGWLEKVGSIS